MVFQPLLFGLIGAEIKISEIDLRTTGLYWIVLVLLALQLVLIYETQNNNYLHDTLSSFLLPSTFTEVKYRTLRP